MSTSTPPPQDRTARVLALAPTRFSALSLLVYVGALAALLLVPLLAGITWPWRHPHVVAPVLTGLWYSVLWARAVRRADRPTTPAPAMTPDLQAPVDRLRRRARRWRTRQVLGLLVIPAVALVMLVGNRSAADDQRLIDHQPAQRATVVGLSGIPLSRADPDVVVEVAGRRVTLALGYPGAAHAKAGDVIDVVVDPDDPTHVIATSSHDDWAYGPWGTLVLTGLLVGIGMYACWVGVPRPGLVRAALHAREARHGSVHGTRDDGVNLWDGGAWWTFTPRTSPLAELAGGDWKPAPGLPVIVLGDARAGTWTFVDDGRTRLPARPLTPGQGPSGT